MKEKSLTVSYSSMNTFKECPKKYWNSKVYSTTYQASAFAFGAAFESGITELLKDRIIVNAFKVFKKEWQVRPANRWEASIEIFDNTNIFYYLSDFDPRLYTNADLKLLNQWYYEIFNLKCINIIDFLKSIETDIKSNNSINEQRKKIFNRACWLCCRRRGILMLKAFERDILPQIEEVISTQKEISIATEDGDKVKGYIDYIVKLKEIDNPVIADLKSAGMIYDHHKIISSDQLSIYSLSENYKTISYMVVLKKPTYDTYCNICGHQRKKPQQKNCLKCKEAKRNPIGKYIDRKPHIKTQILIHELSEASLNREAEDIAEIITAIKNKLCWRNPNSCYNFHTQCEYYDACWNGKALEDLPHLKKR